MTAIQVDFRPVYTKITKVLSTASEEIQRRATYNALNHVGDKALTQVRRTLARQTSAPYGRVMSHVWSTRAHPGRLSYRIDAKDKPMPLKDFLSGTHRAGQRKVTAVVWGKKVTYSHHVFMVGPKGGKTRYRRGLPQKGSSSGLFPVKRVKSGHGPGSLRMLYGPIIPLQMLSQKRATFHYLQTVTPTEFLPRLQHEIAQAIIRAAK